MNHVYDTATGRLISSTILDIPAIPGGMSVKVSELTGIWNETTLDFDPVPIKRIITKLDFIGRFTDSELEAIISKSKEVNSAGDKVGVFLKKLDVADNVDLDDVRLVAGVNGMEQIGIIGSGRASVILNG